MVNWENLDGDLVEKLVAALILLDNPQGNRITPSRGDRGVDVIVETPTGAVIYQVKRYTRPLTTAQRREIEQSWQRVVERIVPEQTVASWTLVMPWDPTHERREWQQALCSTHPGITIGWLGRSQLDYLASQHPRLVDYFLGGGQARTLELMAQAIGGGEPLSSDLEGERLLEAIARRQDALIDALNEVDPFYRCEREVRYGRLTERWNMSEIDPRGAVWIKFEQLTDDRFAMLRWIPLCAESQWMRPIGFQLNLTAQQGSAEHEAIQRFTQYGAPFTNVPGEVTASSGPAGAAIPPGHGLFSIAQSSVSRADMVELEYRICEPDGSVVASADLFDVEITRGLIEDPGYRVAGRDQSGFLHIAIQIGIADAPQRLSIDRLDFVGLTPREVLPAARLCAATTPGRLGEVAIRDGGRSLTGPWLFDDAPEIHQVADNCADLVRLCENLMEIQRHTLTRVVLPPADTPTAWNEHISDVADLIRGIVIERRWMGPLAFVNDQQPDFDHSVQLEVLIDEVLVADVVGSILETDVHVRRLIRGAAFTSEANGEMNSLLVPADGVVATERLWRVDDAGWVRHRVLARPIPAEPQATPTVPPQ